MTLIAAGTIVLEDRVCKPGWLAISAGRIIDCAPGPPPRPPDHDFADHVVVPGFVDMHVHGGGGASYADGIGSEIEQAAEFHLRHGTTTTVASLVTASPKDLLRQVRVLSEMTRQKTVAGVHLEGPWLSAVRCGAHDASLMRNPDPAEIDALLTAADGTIRMVTLAPELPGSQDAITRIVDAAVVVAIGHTDAGYDDAQRAIESGATVGTHVFNAMRPLHHREPGPALALLEDPRITVELIADGVHLHPALVRQVIETVGPDRVALVTDAMAAAGLPDGSFRMGAVEVEVTERVARVRGTSTIAGSTTTMDKLFRTAVGQLGGSDEALVKAARMTATTPAHALKLDRVGSLRVGMDANCVVLEEDLRVQQVMRNGSWLLHC
ncbi:N-acetylglucosamine-6-phosphate deacetylase [Mycolicibacterium novocastrense]|uniref:N-acetylglucosamine-6-phosphate deacetylase n=1 Tax=Mycolicibacterium novocastrense TaxID=59813 RepID=UPI00074A9EB6|nr:N-acetylglucosamine-6-phosphate deacetylase [Mycolicibacterium novocastrense]KUH73633.1 N-acetylglucosamine-6-phosphate deacetylase [Mycolicibacterium novocastrense]KUH74726.1 N-acetylglucosamine-6-phosphate deacetylase [Mycolicibacterium novocastrense]KUH76040.1 N-acetylglucosamine-6-phosphate deacetylase [Mycolicibacterium novocastrense]